MCQLREPAPVGWRDAIGGVVGGAESDAERLGHRRFPPGLPGLVKAIRNLAQRPYDALAGRLAFGAFPANAIGYRLIELLDGGTADDATSAMTSLASGRVFE